MSRSFYRAEPRVRWSDFSLTGIGDWEAIDQIASSELECECIGVPSIRVGICWTLEYLGCDHHQDHILVPRFMGRCVLNALNRHALPVSELSSRTRVVVAVDQFGLRQKVPKIADECARRGIHYLEDSPYGISKEEASGPGSLARFVGLSKILPVLKGALMFSTEPDLIEFMKQKRQEYSAWSWLVLGALTLIRRRRRTSGHSVLAEVAYELYVASGGDNRFIRGNIALALRRMVENADLAADRIGLVRRYLSDRVLFPDTEWIPYAIPYTPDESHRQVREILEREDFNSALYHIDINRNVFSPRYQKFFLIPLNPRIPFGRFEKVVRALASLS